MSYVLDWSDGLRPVSVEWGLTTPQRGTASAFDGSSQVQTLGAPRWFFTVSTGPINRDLLPYWEALVQQLRGRVNRVRAWDWRREQPLGPFSAAALGTPTVRVAGGGASLQTEGWPANYTGAVLAGSYVGLGSPGELKRLSGTVNTDSAGRATISFEPPTRASVPVGTGLVLAKPPALFVMTTERPSFLQEGARHRPVTLSFEEDFRPG